MFELCGLSDNDNRVTGVHIEDNLKICIEKWDGGKCCIVGVGCCKFALDGSTDFEIGNIEIRNGCDFSDEWEKEFIAENHGYRDLKELIIYDAWITNRVDLRAIAENFELHDSDV